MNPYFITLFIAVASTGYLIDDLRGGLVGVAIVSWLCIIYEVVRK